MFKKTLAFMTAFAAAACMFVSCGDSKKEKSEIDTEERYELCNKNGVELEMSMVFHDNDKFDCSAWMRSEYDEDNGRYNIIDSDTIEIKGLNNKSYNGEFYYEIIDDSKIYIEDFADIRERQFIDEKACDLYMAVNCTAADLDSQDITSVSRYLICSDDIKTIIPASSKPQDFPTQIIDNIRPFFGYLSDYDYIIDIDNGVCVGIAVIKKGCNKVGTYPQNAIAEDYDSSIEISDIDSMKLDDIYELYRKQF